MYATPATGSSQNANELEDYLLGKKRVDKILTADENAKVSPDSNTSVIDSDTIIQLGATHKNFIAVQNANTARDIASKIREDPLLAIKQQEQASYQALLSNPLRLKKMQEQLGVKPKKSKEEKRKEKEERKRLKHERKHRKDRSRSSGDRYSRSPSPPSRRHDRGRISVDDHYSHSRSHRYRSSSRPHSPGPSERRDEELRHVRSRSKSPRRDDDRYRAGSSRSNGYHDRREEDRPRRYQSPPRALENGKRSRSPSPRRRSPPPKRIRHSPPPPRAQNPPSNGASRAEADRAARLAAMQVNAGSMSEERQHRLAALLEKEKAELAADELARQKSKGMSGFLSQESKKVFGGTGGLEDRIKRGRGGMVVDAD